MNAQLAVKLFACNLMRPAMRLAPRGAIRLLTVLGGGRQNDTDWNALARRYRVFYDRSLRATVIADLRDWGGRWHYYPGTYYDPLSQAIIRKYLTSGGVYIDIGANVGIHTLLASRVVGDQGWVYAFEPAPRTFAFLSAHLAMNGCKNVTATQCALTDEAGVAELACPHDHLGTATLRRAPCEVSAYDKVVVATTTGDEVLGEIDLNLGSRSRVVVKIDVEGYEHRVVHGMRSFLSQSDRIVVSMEITPAWLIQAGSSKERLLAEMQALGFEAYVPRLIWRWGMFRPVMKLFPGVPEGFEQIDVLFAKGTPDLL